MGGNDKINGYKEAVVRHLTSGTAPKKEIKLTPEQKRKLSEALQKYKQQQSNEVGGMHVKYGANIGVGGSGAGMQVKYGANIGCGEINDGAQVKYGLNIGGSDPGTNVKYGLNCSFTPDKPINQPKYGINFKYKDN